MSNKEVEIRFININQNKLKKRLKEIGGKVYQKRYKMEVINYKHPTKNYTVRLRDEGRNKTMTIKKDLDKKYPTEYEIVINDIKQGHNILDSLGCKIIFRNEKYREFWHIKGAKEVVFDELPGLPVFVEVDCHNEKELFSLCTKLGLNPKNAYNKGGGYLYGDLYGIPPLGKHRKASDLTFNSASKVFSKYITKNKKQFNEILKKQKKYKANKK